jgi:hypothetical protein
MPQVCDLLGVRGMQVQQEPEAVKVCLDIIVVGVALFKSQSGIKLALRCRLQPDGDGCRPNLRALCVEISTKTLKMGAEMQDEAS